MSLDKAIASGKEHRKEYYGCESIDARCRCHGGCGWCEENRKHKYLKKLQEDIDKLIEDYYNDEVVER